MVKWTQQQHTAITREGSLLVAAAAGAGKTAVLTARIVEKVRAGADVRALLVVTFTKAAAGEMKKRIAAALHKAQLEEADPAEAERLREAAERVGDADISTMHAFCASVLRRHFYEAGLDPAFRAADEAEADILLGDALDELMEQRAAQPAFAALTDIMDGPEALAKAIRALRAYTQAQPDPDAWMQAAADAYDTTEQALAASPLMQTLLRALKTDMESALLAYRAARDELVSDFESIAAMADSELMQLRGALLQSDGEKYVQALRAVDFPRMVFPRGTEDALKTPLQSARKNLKAALQKQCEALARTLSEDARRMRMLHPHVEELCACARELSRLYGDIKRERGVIDYNDMEHMTLALLQNEAVAREYRARFSYIFMDEYQDANRVQEAILNALRREDNLFLVGDVKQSIYGFRLAEPAMFMEKYDDPAAFGLSVVDLNANFRSAGAVIDAVNTVFSTVMSKRVGGVDYDARAALVQGRPAKGSVELLLTPRAEGDEQLEAAEAEILMAAARIRDIMQNETYTPDGGAPRPYRFGDFAILHRSPKRVAERMLQLLSQSGIPAYAELTGGYFDAIEVQVFLNLLRVLDNRCQDIPLLSVMRSMIGGFTDAELASLRLLSAEDGWAELLTKAARGDAPDVEQDAAVPVGATPIDAALCAKAAAFLDRLDEWYEESGLLSVCALCGKLLDETGYGDYCAALPGGRLRRANLDALCERAAAFESEAAKSLSGFIAWMDRIKNTDRMGAASLPGGNVVRLLSMHKSKGLEFPVVILTGLSKTFNMEDAKANMVLHAALGIGLRYREGDTRYDTLPAAAIRAAIAERTRSEELRILYVAMTRARDRLIMVLSDKDPQNAIEKHARTNAALCAKANSAGDWLLYALLSRPEGNALRAYAGLPALPGTPTLTARVGTALRTAADRPDRAQYEALKRSARAADTDELRERLDQSYPYKLDVSIPGKISVSELSGNTRGIRAYPDFIQQTKPLSAVERGTAAHLVMQLLPLRAHTRESVRAFIEELVAQGRLTPRQAEVLQPGAAAAFFASPLGVRLCASKRVERELMFNYRVGARELMGLESDETLLLQGVIDCCFIEDDAWILLDYKTDYVPEGEAKNVARTHARQLALYAAALRALSGIPVRERYIHFLRTGESVRLYDE